MRPSQSFDSAAPAARESAFAVKALAIVALAFIAYAPVWKAGFVWDDNIMLTENPVIRSADGLRAIWFSTQLPDYFPLTSTVLWLEWRMFGEHPLGYHLANVLFHAVAMVGCWRILQHLRVPGAWLAAALLAVHPVNVESVAWITEHKNTLALMFGAWSVWAYLKFDDTRMRCWYAIALGLFALAAFSKTAVVPLPFVLLALIGWRRGNVTTADFLRAAPFIGVACVLASITLWFHDRTIGTIAVREDDLLSRTLGAGMAIWFYLWKVVWPTNLSFIYPRWTIDPGRLLHWIPLLTLALGVCLCWRYRRGWGRSGLFGIVALLLLLGPVLGLVNISFMRFSFVADRWQYFALIVPLAFVATGVVRLLGRHRMLLAATSGALLVVLTALTQRQSSIYQSLETLWTDTLRKNPNCTVAHADLGNVWLRQGRVVEALQAYRRALELDPTYELAHYNLGFALLQRGETSEAVHHLNTAVELQPDFAPAHHQLARVALDVGNMAAAEHHLRTTLSLKPTFAEAHGLLGTLCLRSSRPADAENAFRAAASYDPANAVYANDHGVALIRLGRVAEALDCFQQAIRLQPGFADAHGNAGRIYAQREQWKEAIAHLRVAVQLRPDDADARAMLNQAVAAQSTSTALQASLTFER
jgi:protein O-mannosyl-transferase